jgi:hypothetical protein
LKTSLRAGSILTVLTLSIAGCDPAEPKVEEAPKSEEHHAAGSKLGPPSPAPPVDPASRPLIPADANPEVKAEEKKEQPKSDTPK